jgi:phage terminase small subunit
VQAALKAGYSKASARISAAANERIPAVREAIQAARGGAAASKGYKDAQAYLEAVLANEELPDPLKVGAARALLPYQQRRLRSPKGNALSPREQQHLDELEEEREASEAWEATVARIEARMQKEKP